MTATPVFPQSIKNGAVQILPADTTTLKTLVTPSANGSKVDNILVNSTDTANKDLVLVITKSGVDYPLATIQIPLNTGNTNAVSAINLLNHSMLGPYLSVDLNGNKYLYLESGSVLKAKVTASVTASKVIGLFAQYGDF